MASASVPLFALPPQLSGVWQGDDRAVLFSGESDAALSLKVYHGWFFDRAAEPAALSAECPRFACAATAREGEEVRAKFEELFPSDGAGDGAWEISLEYGGRRGGGGSAVPVAVIDGRMYFDFALRAEGGQDSLDGFWRGVSAKDALRVCPTEDGENIFCHYVDGDEAWRIRYWLTDMEFDDSPAYFSDGERSFSVPRHIKSCGKIFACVSGRRKNIRAVEKLGSPFKPAATGGGGRVCALGAARMEKADGADYMKIVAEANSRRKPAPPPIFPPSELDWHLDEIERLEEGNPIVQEVRRRSKEFIESRGKQAKIDAAEAASMGSRLKLENEIMKTAE